jgi:outer membrane protein assembly factor BamD
MILLSACNKEYRQIQKSRDSDEKYVYAKRMYEEGKLSRALAIFEEIRPFMRGRENFEEMTYTMAYAYYKSRDYFMAASVFENYTRLFPSSEKAEECFYMAAYCMVLDVPYYKLDQSNATNAIRQLQLFINYYPRSAKVQEANDFIDALRLQLARKAYELANNYYRRSLYLSASISFKNVIKDFPETRFREEAMYMNVKSLYFYAHHSINERQAERYFNTIEAYEQLERAFPESQYLSRLKTYVTTANNFIDKQKG